MGFFHQITLGFDISKRYCRFYKKQIGFDHEKMVEFTHRTWQRLYTLEAKKLDKVA